MSSTLPIISPAQRSQLRDELLEVVEYRKSGLSLNHVIGCPLDCAYCVRHLFDNFEMKVPRALMSDEEAVETLIGHRFFQPNLTPVQVFNRATDPMLPAVKPHTLNVLDLLDEHGFNNNVLVITCWRVSPADCEVLNSFQNIKVTLLITHSGIRDERIEPVDSQIAADSLATAFKHAGRYRVVLYWRPIVPGLNDSDGDLAHARELSEQAHATVYTGLFYRDQISAYYEMQGLPLPYDGTAPRKILPERLEARILAAFQRPDGTYGPLFRKTSCAVSYAHGLPDYNGHYGIRELCDICPMTQIGLCARAHRRPAPVLVAEMASDLGGKLVDIDERAVSVAGLDEQRRYLMRHARVPGTRHHQTAPSPPSRPRRHRLAAADHRRGDVMTSQSLAGHHAATYDLVFKTQLEPTIPLGTNKPRDPDGRYRTMADQGVSDVLADLALTCHPLTPDNQAEAAQLVREYVHSTRIPALLTSADQAIAATPSVLDV